MRDDKDFGLIVNSAVRYACGRRTYIVGVVCNYVKRHINDLDEHDLENIILSIESKRDMEYVDEPLGDQCDEEKWLSLLDLVKKELENRK